VRIPNLNLESLNLPLFLVARAGRSSRFCLHLIRQMRMVRTEQESMSKRIQHIVTGLLLTSYLFVGALAPLESFGKLIAFGTGPAKVEQHKPARPVPAKVCWTQYKHIPSFIKVTLLSSALVTPLALHPLELHTLLPVLSDVWVTVSQENTSVSSRAPPLLSAIS
jgi:hypothetical protein